MSACTYTVNDVGNCLPHAAPSPRISGGTIKWYAGDTFTLLLHVALTDADGAAVTLGAADTLWVTFYDRSLRTVYRFVCTEVQNDTAALVFDDEVSVLFPAGEYSCDVVLQGDRRVTLAKGCPVIVE